MEVPPFADKGAEQRQHAKLKQAATDGQQAGLRIDVPRLLATVGIIVRSQKVLNLYLWSVHQQCLLLQLISERFQASVSLRTIPKSFAVACLQLPSHMHLGEALTAF